MDSHALHWPEAMDDRGLEAWNTMVLATIQTRSGHHTSRPVMSCLFNVGRCIRQAPKDAAAFRKGLPNTQFSTCEVAHFYKKAESFFV